MWFINGIERVTVNQFKGYELTTSDEKGTGVYILKHDGKDIAHVGMIFGPTGLILNVTKEKEPIPEGLIPQFKEVIEEHNRDALGIE